MDIVIHPDLLERLDTRRKQILADLIVWLRDYSDGEPPKAVTRGVGSKKTALGRFLGSSIMEREFTHEGRPTIFVRSEDMSEKAEFIPGARVLEQLASESYITPKPPNLGKEQPVEQPAPQFTPAVTTEPPPPPKEDDLDLDVPTPPPAAGGTSNKNKKRIRRDPFIQSIISIIADEEERKAIQRSYDSYLIEFPEISAAPDRACLASLLTTELAMFRLQKRVVQHGETLGKEYSSLQDAWNKAAETLRLTRDQRVSDGESDGLSFAQLVERYDDLQAQAMIQLAEQLKEEDALRERTKDRTEREADTGGGETILRDGFGIGVDRSAGRLVPLERLKEAAPIDDSNTEGWVQTEAEAPANGQ